MALNFPNSPTLNQVYTDSTSGFSYQWNGTVWISFSPASSSQIKTLDDISSGFNNSTQTFALTSGALSISPPTSQSLIINLGGVIQDATDDYSVSGSNITFSTAPTNGLSFSGISLGPAIPVDYANNGNVYTRNIYTATASQTVFTITGTYTVGYIEVYQNGVRLTEGTDFTATNGTTFVLTTPANLSDEVVSVAYKVASLVTTTGQFDNLIISGISTFVGLATHTGTIFGSNLSLTGVVTATSFSGSGANLTGIATTENVRTNSLVVSGISTLGTVVVGGATTQLIVVGNARVTGILTIGTGSITLNGSTNIINVGTGLTLSSSGVNVTGVITATSFVGSGSGLTGVGPSSQDVTSQAGITTINLSSGNVIYFTHNTDTTVAFANTSTTQEITFIRTKDDTETARAITWPTSVRWPDFGVAPTLQSNGGSGDAQTFKLVTRDSGLNWYGWQEQIYFGSGQFLFAWGRNASGQLGQNSTTRFSSPVQIPGATWSSISSGTDYLLATKTDNTLWAWGANTRGNLGQNNTINCSSPIQIPGTSWNKINACRFSLATKTDGTLWSWGYNPYGNLGQNNTTYFSSPVQIPGTSWSSISAGIFYSLATKTDNTLWAWGYNYFGKLGQNNTTYYSSPVQIPGTTWSSISGGDKHSLATKTDNTLWAWGSNTYGRLGQNTVTPCSSPVQIPGTTWSAISTGDKRSLATKTDNTLWAWGNNALGELGQSNVTYQSSPVQIPGTTWSAISAGFDRHSLAKKTDGTLWAWGVGSNGQLGQNNVAPRSSPIQIPGTQWSLISSGSYHSLATFVIT
jgi:alpha-tubulin suppressor-like RCC1 family protein